MGAILTSRQSAALRAGSPPLHAFLQGYQLALVIAAGIVAIGVPVAWITLRTPKTPIPAEQPPVLLSA